MNPKCDLCGREMVESYMRSHSGWDEKPKPSYDALCKRVAELEALLKASESKGRDCPVHGPVVSDPCIWCKYEDAESLDGLVKHMVNRFLGWKLPEDFVPDAGISFERVYNQHRPWPSKHEPTGTNLFTAIQAEAMIRHMLEAHHDETL